MKQLILLTIALALPTIASAKDTGREEGYAKRIQKGCLNALSSDEDDMELKSTPEAICRCVARELKANTTAEELELLARSNEFDSKAEEELQEPRREALVEKDYEITEGCREAKNPDKWAYGQE